jgi:predicted HAD superfamily Cof-like phosphohydrolase
MSGMNQVALDVAAFHLATDTPVLATPAFPSDARCALREELIVEEVLRELLPALRARNMEGVADGGIDSIYVIVGLLLECGVPIAECWDAVQRANLQKAVLQPDGTLQVIKRPDGKVVKPEGWSPPDIVGILRANGWKG